MSTPSAKFQLFMNARFMDATTLGDIPGIGPKGAAKLEAQGINTPAQLLGKFLVLGEDAFRAWLKETVPDNTTDTAIGETVNGMREKWDKMMQQ